MKRTNFLNLSLIVVGLIAPTLTHAQGAVKGLSASTVLTQDGDGNLVLAPEITLKFAHNQRVATIFDVCIAQDTVFLKDVPREQSPVAPVRSSAVECTGQHEAGKGSHICAEADVTTDYSQPFHLETYQPILVSAKGQATRNIGRPLGYKDFTIPACE